MDQLCQLHLHDKEPNFPYKNYINKDMFIYMGAHIVNYHCVSVVVGFRPSSGSRHVSRRIRSIPSDQRIRCASRPSMGLRRKPRVLRRAHTRPKLPARICNYQASFRDHVYSRTCSQKLISDEAILLVGVTSLRNEDPL